MASPRCERPDCRTPGRTAAWWVWAPGYPRHALCSDCLEPFTERLNETNAPTLGKLNIEPIDPHSRRRSQIALGGNGR